MLIFDFAMRETERDSLINKYSQISKAWIDSVLVKQEVLEGQAIWNGMSKQD